MTLEDLRDGMRSLQYPATVPARGWAGIHWRSESEEPPSLNRGNPGLPAIEDFGDGYRMLLARLYDDRINRALVRKVGRNFEGLTREQQYDVVALDVAIVEGKGLYVFVASHEDQEVGIALAELRRAAKPPDGDWAVTSLPKIEPESDLYLWMLHRWHVQGGSLTPTLKVVEFNTLSTRDVQDHVIRSLSGIDLSRVDTLGAAAEAHDLGPAKFVLFDSQTKLRADIFLLRQGTFDVHRAGTVYEFPLDKAQLGIFATVDIATKVLPRLHNAHKSDKDWPTKNRPAFVEDCRQALADRFRLP
jgi:hypothetical protein